MNPISIVRDLPNQARGLVEDGAKALKRGTAIATLGAASFLPMGDATAQEGTTTLTSRKANTAEVSNADLVGRTRVENSFNAAYERRLQEIIDGATKAGVLKSEADFVVNGEEGSDKKAAEAYKAYVARLKSGVKSNFKDSPNDFSRILTHMYVFANGKASENKPAIFDPVDLKENTETLLSKYDNLIQLHSNLRHISWERTNNGVNAAQRDLQDLLDGKKLYYIAQKN